MLVLLTSAVVGFPVGEVTINTPEDATPSKAPLQGEDVVFTKGVEDRGLIGSPRLEEATPSRAPLPEEEVVVAGVEDDRGLFVNPVSEDAAPSETALPEELLVEAREEEEQQGLIGGNPGLLMGVEEDDVDVVEGELMETANSGLVFRPQFRYRKQSRRRYNRTPSRRGPQFLPF